jgi:hypothetical protein
MPQGCLSNGSEHNKVAEELEDHHHLEILHNTTILAVSLGLHAPSNTTVVDGPASSQIDDEMKQAATKGNGHVHKHHEELGAARGYTSKHWVLKFFVRIKACQLGVLVNIVGVGVVLLVHDVFVLIKLKADHADDEEGGVIDPLAGLPGIVVKELMLASKCKALELKAIKDVERKECCNLSSVLRTSWVKGNTSKW